MNRTTELPGVHALSRTGRMVQPARSSAVHEQVAAVATLSRADLVEQWILRYGRPPPKGLSRRLLEHAAANALQANVFGGLKPKDLRKLKLLARSDRVDIGESTKTVASKELAPGSRLVREWNGHTYTVEVLETGFLLDGRSYRSLSAIAHVITGARWSGPRFFGL